MIKMCNLFMLVPLPFLGGCPGPLLCIKVTDTQPEHFTLAVHQGSHCTETANIQVIEVTSMSRNKTLWYINAVNISDYESQSLSQVIYGETPKGFVGKPPVRLMRGETVEVLLRGLTDSRSITVTLDK